MKANCVALIEFCKRLFYYRCLEKPVLSELLDAGVYNLMAPGIDALHEIIVRPAERAGLTFKGGLKDKLLQDAIAAPGAFPLLAFALAELYKMREGPTRTLTHEAYKSFGGLSGAITERAEATFKALDADAKAAGEGVFRELVQVDERGMVTRQRTVRDSFAANKAALRLIDAFTKSYLLVTGQSESHQPVVEVAHEALLKSWPRLQAWVESTLYDRQLLAQMRLAAQLWNERGRQRAYLWTNARAGDMIKMLANLKPPISETEQAFARPEADHLLDELSERDTTHDRRAQIGDRLADLGDPRPGVGLRPDGLPDLDWCHVQLDIETATTQRTLRSSIYAGEHMIDVAIEGTGSVRVGAFYIARYPVTYAQYRAFLENGFRNAEWWKGLAASGSTRASPGA